jgi:hypothetical protein
MLISSQLFGGSAFTKEYLFKLQDYNKASWFQNFIASIAGASASLVVSAPLDVIKTRIQNRNFENPESGFRILSNMARYEGFPAFFKGLVPKVRPRSPDRGDCGTDNSVAVDDRTEIGVLVLASTNIDSSLRYIHHRKMKFDRLGVGEEPSVDLCIPGPQHTQGL